MPNYDYRCKKCGKIFNVFHKMSENPKINCPECGGLAEKIMSYNSNIIFKGEGFYVNDYKKSKNSTKSTNKRVHNDNPGSKHSKGN